jgi:hypothetical protein
LCVYDTFGEWKKNVNFFVVGVIVMCVFTFDVFTFGCVDLRIRQKTHSVIDVFKVINEQSAKLLNENKTSRTVIEMFAITRLFGSFIFPA